MSYITLIGIVAAIITTTSFLPQVIKIYKTKNTKDISLSMYYLITSGIILWLVYGILVKDLPIIIANGVTFILVCSILVMKLKYK
ncbi:SemiSWEET transporter [Portibacter lacus]|nr:SemiSWEET transporter [Portibacter lacus]